MPRALKNDALGNLLMQHSSATTHHHAHNRHRNRSAASRAPDISSNPMERAALARRGQASHNAAAARRQLNVRLQEQLQKQEKLQQIRERQNRFHRGEVRPRRKTAPPVAASSTAAGGRVSLVAMSIDCNPTFDIRRTAAELSPTVSPRKRDLNFAAEAGASLSGVPASTSYGAGQTSPASPTRSPSHASSAMEALRQREQRMLQQRQQERNRARGSYVDAVTARVRDLRSLRQQQSKARQQQQRGAMAATSYQRVRVG